MKTETKIIIYALAAVVALMIVGFIPMKCHAQTLDMSFGQVTNMNVYRMKIQVSEDITWKWLTVTPYGGWTTWSQWASNSINGIPFRDTYDIGIKVNVFENWFVDFNHYCTHDVISRHNSTATNPSFDNSNLASPDPYYNPVSNPKWTNGRWDSTLTTITIGYHKTFSSILL